MKSSGLGFCPIWTYFVHFEGGSEVLGLFQPFSSPFWPGLTDFGLVLAGFGPILALRH